MTPRYDLPEKVILHFDGACWPNPGHGSYGWVLYDEDMNEWMSESGDLGDSCTNNVAEWHGLRAALTTLREIGWNGSLTIRGDSQLVINQLNEKWRAKKKSLAKLRAECWELLSLIREWRAEWVPRASNTRADEVSTASLI